MRLAQNSPIKSGSRADLMHVAEIQESEHGVAGLYAGTSYGE